MSDTTGAIDNQGANTASAQLKALLDAAVDAIVLIDGQGLIQGFNRAAERMFGYRAEEVLGENVSLLMPEPYRHEHDDYIARYRRTGEARIIGIGREVTARLRDGSQIPIELSVGEIADDHGPARFVGFVRDISARRQAEEEAAAHRESLAHMARLGTIAEMGTGIAHEINQPLSAISAYARASQRLLAGETPDLEAARRALGHIAGQAHRASEILQHLRGMVRRRTSERELVSPEALLDDLKPLAEVDARQYELDIEWRIAPDLPRVRVDPVQIQQVLVNLFHNAAQAMDEQRGDDNRIVIGARPLDAHELELSVRDHGPGLAESDTDRLMEPFVTSKSDGLGMGLGICRSIVSAHGGVLSLRNAGATGAIAAFTLPVADHV